MTRKILLSLFCSLLVLFGYTQPITSVAIDSLTARTMRAFDVPGIAVAVIKGGKVIHSKGYGVRSIASMKKVDEQTLFGIASNSKAFTAAALCILVDEGKIKWDDKVREYIPEFKMYDPYVTEEFTIRDLLTHRSGLGLGAGDLMLFPDSNDFTLTDVIYNLRFLKPVSAFRTKYDYDNNMYVIAGEVVARVSGMSWDAFVEKRIFKPLGMTRSACAYDLLKDKTNVIDGHAAIDGKVQVIKRDKLKLGHSAGGIYSNIADLSKWVMVQLANGKYDGSKQLFSEAVHEEMWTPQTIIPVHGPSPYQTHFAAYGLGFFIADVKGYKQISHTGGLEGMVTQITMIPELGLGIIVLTNQQEGGAFSAITNQIKDAYLGVTGTDRVTEYAARRDDGAREAKAITDSVWRIVDGTNEPADEFVSVSRWSDKDGHHMIYPSGLTEHVLLGNAGWKNEQLLFFAYNVPGPGRIEVYSWEKNNGGAPVTVAADEFTDKQMTDWGYRNKRLVFYGSTRNGENKVPVYRYQTKDKYWQSVPEYTELSKDSMAVQGYSKKTYQYYGLKRPSVFISKVPDVTRYTGSYKDPWFGDMMITVKNGQAWIESKKSHKLTGELLFFRANTYVAKWTDRSMDADAFVSFSLDEDGKPTGFTMKAISPATDFSFDFQDLDFKRQ